MFCTSNGVCKHQPTYNIYKVTLLGQHGDNQFNCRHVDSMGSHTPTGCLCSLGTNYLYIDVELTIVLCRMAMIIMTKMIIMIIMGFGLMIKRVDCSSMCKHLQYDTTMGHHGVVTAVVCVNCYNVAPPWSTTDWRLQ